MATEWALIRTTTNCAIDWSHYYPQKTAGGGDVTVEDGRGASALLSAARSARVLNHMSKEDAAKVGIEAGSEWRYFRVDNGKASMAPPAAADWYKLESVMLGNGDSVGVATTWKWDPFSGVTVSQLRQAQKEVGQGRYRESHQADNWVGLPIAAALGLDPVAHRGRIKTLLATWIKNDMFRAGGRQGRRPAQDEVRHGRGKRADDQ